MLCIFFRLQTHYHAQALIQHPPKEALDVPLVIRGQKSNWSAEAYKQVCPPNRYLVSENVNSEKVLYIINVGVIYAGNARDMSSPFFVL